MTTTNATVTKQTLVIIDTGVDDYQILELGIIPTAKVTVLNKHQDGIAQISALCHNYPAASIQIIAHGSPGSLQLGNSQLNLANLHSYRQQLQQWLAAEILIYGCEVAGGERGKTLIEQLHQLTGANIAASTGKIGNAQQGGTWELEVKTGQITSTLALQPEIRETYPGVLATFATATNFTVGTNPFSVTVQDFNGDGKLDLATANINSNDVSVLLGTGTGSFATATNFTVGISPYSITVGDFNDDGNLDLATANINSNDVSVLLGTGSGSFATATNFTVGTDPFSVTVGDFNDDGNLDLATTNRGSNNVSVLLNTGSGSFGTATNFTVGTDPASITVRDFNGDGKLDLAIANKLSNNVSVLLNTGSGSFGIATNFTVGTDPVSITVGDFNGDGNLDLSTANRGSNDVSVLLGTGSGSFGIATNFTVGTDPVSVTVGDFNGDGNLDLSTANRSSNDVSVLLGTGSGSFGTVTNFTVGTNPFSVTVGDFNGDGKLDLSTANRNSNNVSVLLDTTPKISITATNTALAYTENDSATIIDPGITVTDAPNLSSATVAITNGFAATEDILAFNDQNGITGSYTNGVLTLTGNATVADYQTALQSVTYQNSSENPSTTPRTISFVASDGNLESTAVTRDINLTAVNDAPTDLELSANTVNDKATANTAIGTFSSTDPDQNDNFAYSLVSGIDDVDNNAFTIDGNSLKINNSPDFKTKSSYKIRIRTTDDGNLTFEKGLTINVNNNVETPSRLTNPNDDVFNIKGDNAKVKLEIKLTGRSSKLVNELGLFTVDDAKGTINGIAPGAEGYAKAAIDRSKVILSAIANTPNGFDTNNLTTLLEFNSGQSLRFLLVQDGTLDAVRNNPNSIGKLLFSSVSTQKITDLGDDSFSLAWKDTSGNSATDFNALVVKIKQTDQALPLGTNLQDKFQGEVIDLRDAKQSVNAQFNVYREASYNNYVGFYQVTDENGGIDTNGDGNADILTGQAGYTQAAVRGRVAGIDLSVSNQGSATYSGTFQPGAIFVPFIIVNDSPDALLDNNSNNDPAVYFPFLGANSDQSDHIRLLASNTFGFEDLPGGGDKDFNDVIIKANLTTTI